MPSDMRADILQACSSAGVVGRVRVVGPHHHAELTRQIAEAFTVLGAHGATADRWWAHLKGARANARVKETLSALKGVLPPRHQVWLLVEDSPGAGHHKMHGSLWLLECDAEAALLMLEHLHYVEYYIVDRKLDWLLCENHHGALLGVGEPAFAWIAALDGK